MYVEESITGHIIVLTIIFAVSWLWLIIGGGK